MKPHPTVLAAAVVALAGLAASVSSHLPAPARVPLVSPALQPDATLDGRLRDLAAKGVVAERIGESRGGRPLHLLRLGDEGKPALLIVAGLNAMHTVGIETALGVAAKLAADHAELLNSHTIYILPCADPDGYARLPGQTPKRDSARTIAPLDDDRDGRVDEDPPADLNGDGFISTMRVYSPPPHLNIEATDIIDPDDRRLTRKPDRMKGEVANVTVLVEGRDQDGDGLIAEDGPDAADLTMNFPWKWPEFQPGAGPHALSEPETRAIAEWLFAHNNVVAVLVFGPHDNLVKVPDAGRMDQTGRIPEGIENDDKPYYEEISKLFKDATKMTGAPTGNPAGSLHGWAYTHLGLYSFTTPVWVRPDLVKKDDAPPAAPAAEEKPAGDAGEAKPAGPTDAEIQALIAEFQGASRDQRRALMERLRAMPQEVQDRVRASFMGAGQPGGGGPGGRGGRGAGGRPGAPGGGAGSGGGSDADDGKWLKYSDTQRNAEGFIPFTPFDHPDLGPVEIGGFVPGFKLNPPDDEIPALVDQQTAFITQLIAKLPRITAGEPVVEDLGGNLFRITLTVSNDGYLPTRTAMGAKARRLPPIRVELALPEERVLSGERFTRIPSLPGSGGSRTIQWLVTGAPGATVTAVIKAADTPDTSVNITLREQLRKAGPIPEPPPPPPPPPAPSPTEPAAPAEKEPNQ